MERLDSRDTLAPTGPSPSLWPEASKPIPAPARRVQFNIAPEMPNTESATLVGTTSRGQQRGIGAVPAVSYDDLVKTRAAPGPTFPSPDPPAATPSRPIDTTATRVFEPHYPSWFSYPPIHPTEFTASRPAAPVKTDFFEPINKFMEQSSAFQSWATKKNADRIQLRHSPAYEKLVERLHKYQHMADEGPTPRIRACARERILQVKKEMVEERKTFSAAELQHIRDIEKAWVSLVSIDNYEQAISKQRHISAMPQPESKRSLSKVELLLGSDGSIPGASSWSQTTCVASQPTRYKLSYEETGVGFTDPNSHNPKEQALDYAADLPAAAEANPWPDKSYEILIPDWFPVAEALGNLQMNGATAEDRFCSLLTYIYQLEFAKSQREYKEKHPDAVGILKDYRWDKHWHPPSPGWRHAHQRRHGGLWKCRKGPTATAAENECQLCMDVAVPKPSSPARILDNVMRCIEEAMAIVAERDKKIVSARIVDEDNRLNSLAALRHQADQHVKMSAIQEDNLVTTGEPEIIPFQTRQSWINYNPLRGLDDSPVAMATNRTQTHVMPTEGEEQKECHDKAANRRRQVPEPNSTDTNSIPWEMLNLSH